MKSMNPGDKENLMLIHIPNYYCLLFKLFNVDTSLCINTINQGLMVPFKPCFYSLLNFYFDLLTKISLHSFNGVALVL